MDRILTNLKKRLEAAELENLRELAVQLQDRLERAEEDALQERSYGEHWYSQAMELTHLLTDQGETIGLTKDGHIGLVGNSAVTLDLAEGECYAGALVGPDGHGHHLILLPGDADPASWDKQKEWAISKGGDLPSRPEQALLFAHLKDQFQEEAYWSNQAHSTESGWAWYQTFYGGIQLGTGRSHELRARAVRRLPI